MVKKKTDNTEAILSESKGKDLEQLMLEKELKIQEQNNLIKDLNKEIKETQKGLKDKESVIQNLNNIVQNQNENLKEKWDQLNSNHKNLDDLTSDLIAKEKVISELSTYQKQLSNSLSWRIGWRTTRVMFFFMKWIPGMKNRLQ